MPLPTTAKSTVDMAPLTGRTVQSEDVDRSVLLGQGQVVKPMQNLRVASLFVVSLVGPGNAKLTNAGIKSANPRHSGLLRGHHSM